MAGVHAALQLIPCPCMAALRGWQRWQLLRLLPLEPLLLLRMPWLVLLVLLLPWLMVSMLLLLPMLTPLQLRRPAARPGWPTARRARLPRRQRRQGQRGSARAVQQVLLPAPAGHQARAAASVVRCCAGCAAWPCQACARAAICVQRVGSSSSNS